MNRTHLPLVYKTTLLINMETVLRELLDESNLSNKIDIVNIDRMPVELLDYRAWEDVCDAFPQPNENFVAGAARVSYSRRALKAAYGLNRQRGRVSVIQAVCDLRNVTSDYEFGWSTDTTADPPPFEPRANPPWNAIQIYIRSRLTSRPSPSEVRYLRRAIRDYLGTRLFVMPIRILSASTANTYVAAGSVTVKKNRVEVV